MDRLTKGMAALCVLLALSTAGAAVMARLAHARAEASQQALSAAIERERALLGELAYVKKVQKAQAKTDASQAQSRVKTRTTVQATLREIHEEEQDAQEARPVGSAAQLDRLRRLTAAANAGVRTAGQLP